MFEIECAQNVYASEPASKVTIPPNTDRLTIVLKCIPGTGLGAVPENWRNSAEA